MLGPLDKRTRRTRCAACSRRRIKCYGGFPCQYCQKTKQNCVAPTNQTSQNAVFVINSPAANHDLPFPTPPESTLKITPTVPSDQLTLLTKHFFDSFLSVNSFLSSSLHSPTTLSSLFSSSPGLYAAAIAIAALDSSRRTQNSQGVTREIVALKAYRAACTALQTELLHEDALTSTAYLWSTVLLGIFELMYDVSGKGWVQHMLYGTSRMLQLRGPAQHISGSGRACFITVRIFEISRALIFEEPTFLAEAEWKELSVSIWEGELSAEWHPKEALYDLMICCADLSSRTGIITNQAKTAPLPEQSPVLLAQAAEGIAIQDALYKWHLDFESWISPASENGDTDDQSLIASIYYHAIIIFLSGIFDYYHHWDLHAAPKLSLQEVRMHVSAIMELCEIGLRTTNVTGPLFFFPLRVAGARAESAEQKSKILEMLVQISKRSFVAANAFMLDLSEWWSLTM